MNNKEYLEEVYRKALANYSSGKSTKLNDAELEECISTLIGLTAKHRAALAVLLTLLSQKIIDPMQDIRCHQVQIPNGFSGRKIDTSHVTPFLKEYGFPAMGTTGWLTRSFEQPFPYTLDYKGKITPNNLKVAFLKIIDKVQEQGASVEPIVCLMMEKLLIARDANKITLSTPIGLSIASIIKLLKAHFTHAYSGPGASRLPVLAIYASYQCMASQLSRFKDKDLLPLESHNSADSQSGRIGDVDVNRRTDNTPFEGVEVKHEIKITAQMVQDAYNKFKGYHTERYYLLTTASMESSDLVPIEAEVEKISKIHGCQVIVNGVYSSLNYYLRLLEEPSDFITNYAKLLQGDRTIKYEHRSAWNDLISRGCF